ncbi:MAG TPA: shikimate dehydrogenase [Candidatus Acidoferrales bacterium]|nr:shikimate dehydrogenase [Candidatus Acidoferrales bacterium]
MAKGFLFAGGRVCGVVAAATAREAWRQFARASRQTRTVELRLDWLKDDAEFLRFISILRKRKRGPRICLIATCRRKEAGGRFAGSVAAQLSRLREALRAGCDWVDLEIESLSVASRFVLDLHTTGARRILSYHNFRAVAARQNLLGLAKRLDVLCKRNGFDAIKIAIECDSIHDGLQVLKLARGKTDVIAVPMGDVVSPLRILALREGSALAYAPIQTGTAPGQVSLDEMRQLYRSDHINRQTSIYGVIGQPVAHSLSPVLHNTGFAERKINAVYLPFLVNDLRDFLGAIEPLGIEGFSVTLPYKEAILRHLDDCDPLAASVGAVNTVVVRGSGKLFGYNTDYVGVLRALERRMPLAGSRVLIFGAGGAARAVAFALARGGASVSICARRPEQAKKLAREVQGQPIPRASLQREFFDAIVNTTPVGMHPKTDQSPLNMHELNCRLVFDTIYRPQRTRLLYLAAQRGIETVSGIEMFLAQGIAQWEIWTGTRAPEAAMQRAVLNTLAAEEREHGKS